MRVLEDCAFLLFIIRAASLLSVVFRIRADMIVDKNKAASWMLRKLLNAQGKATPLPQAAYNLLSAPKPHNRTVRQINE